jgi:tetratricopeptide (TPR) repeat protein
VRKRGPPVRRAPLTRGAPDVRASPFRRHGIVLWGQFVSCLVRAELEQAGVHADEISQLGEARSDASRKCIGSRFKATICYYLGKFIDARTHMENTLSLWQPAFRVAAVTAEDTYLAALSHLSGALLCLGYVDQAQRRRDEALTEARQLTAYNRAFGLFLAWHRYWAI